MLRPFEHSRSSTPASSISRARIQHHSIYRRPDSGDLIQCGAAMHLLHRSSMLGGGASGGRAALRRVDSSPRAAPPRQSQKLFSKSESIKKRKKGSKRARLRAGLAAALQDLRLAGRGRKHEVRRRGAAGAGAARPCYDNGEAVAPHLASASAAVAGAAPKLPVVAAGAEAPASRSGTTDGGSGASGWPMLLVMALLALVCVVALGRAPAVCCCTGAAWLLCPGPSADDRRRSARRW